ncbi:MAG: endonuclease/exonuclease/phosphatase family protein [Candidatus Hydrogenedentes bacterium]|nr:endonuclease/exonuclease/phosphatase family protein [Candidatus Hydrogenedentota bacterium]
MRRRAASWNIHGCVGPGGQHDVDRVARVLRTLDADVIGLQEVDWRHPAGEKKEVLAYLADALGMHAVEGPNLHDHRGRYGNGLLTRLPVLGYRQRSLACDGREPRGAIDATLDTGDGRLRVIVTHLGLNARERRMQLNWLREAASAHTRGDYMLLLGDLNEWFGTRTVRRALTPQPFSALFTGRTFPSRWPLFSLDCILAEPAPRALSGRVVRTPEARLASDHLPVVADIAWDPCGAP